MSDDDFKRLENKVDALLMGLLQVAFVQEMQMQIDCNRDHRQAWHTNAQQGDRNPVMKWNSAQAIKVIQQGLKGEPPKFDD